MRRGPSHRPKPTNSHVEELIPLSNGSNQGGDDGRTAGIPDPSKNAEAGFALASELAKAKDLQDVLRLQSNFAQMQMQSYARQAQELGRLMTEATRSGESKG